MHIHPMSHAPSLSSHSSASQANNPCSRTFQASCSRVSKPGSGHRKGSIVQSDARFGLECALNACIKHFVVLSVLSGIDDVNQFSTRTVFALRLVDAKQSLQSFHRKQTFAIMTTVRVTGGGVSSCFIDAVSSLG
jgi:hypothetical protein